MKPRRLTAAIHLTIALTIRRCAERLPAEDPRFLARRLSFDLAPRASPLELTTAACVVFEESVCPRARARSIYCELARACLLRAEIVHDEGDVEAIGELLARGAAIRSRESGIWRIA